VKEVHGVRVVVDTIEEVVILRWPKAIRRKGATGRVTTRIRLGGVDTGRKLRQKREIPAIQREVIHIARINDLPDGSILRLQHRQSGSDLDGCRYVAGLKREVRDHVFADFDRDITLLHGLETLIGDSELVAADSYGRELVDAIEPSCGRESSVRAFVGERYGGAADGRA